MKTCRLSASSLVSPRYCLSSVGGILRIVSLFDVEEIYPANLNKRKSLRTDKDVFTAFLFL